MQAKITPAIKIIVKQISLISLFISLFFAFLFWLLLLFGLQIIDPSGEADFNVVVGILAAMGFIVLCLSPNKGLWKAVLRSILLFTILLSFFLAWAFSLDYSDAAFKNAPLRCDPIVSPDGQKTFVILEPIPSDAIADVGWIYYKNLPFIGKEVDSVRYCDSRWIDNDTIAVPASSYYGTLEQTVYAGIEFNWFSLAALTVLSLVSYFAIRLSGIFVRIIKNAHS